MIDFTAAKMNEYENVGRVRSVPTNDFHGKEIACDQRVHVRLDEVLPGNRPLSERRLRCRTKTILYHDISNRCLADEDTEFLEFPADAAIAPSVVLSTDPMDEPSDGLGDAATPGAFESYSSSVFAHPGFVRFRHDHGK